MSGGADGRHRQEARHLVNYGTSQHVKINMKPKTVIPAFEMNVVPGSARDFEMWRWTISPLYDISALRREDLTQYGMESAGYFYPQMPISSARLSGTRLVRDNRVIAKGGIDSIQLVLYEEGNLLVDADGTERTVKTGDILAIDFARRSTISSRPTRAINVTVSRDLLMPLVANPDSVHGAWLPRGAPLNELLASHMRGLIAAGPHVDLATGAAVARATATLAAACLGGAPHAREQTGSRLQAAVMYRIRQLIEQELGNPELGTAFLIQRFAVSRATLYRLFEPLGGVRNYINQRRLMRIHQLIVDPEGTAGTLSDLAAQWGFPDRTVFSRAYRSLYGMSPTEARLQAHIWLKNTNLSEPGIAGSFSEVNRRLLEIDALSTSS
jgi:AraC-like DNA-binding protein